MRAGLLGGAAGAVVGGALAGPLGAAGGAFCGSMLTSGINDLIEGRNYSGALKLSSVAVGISVVAAKYFYPEPKPFEMTKNLCREILAQEGNQLSSFRERTFLPPLYEGKDYENLHAYSQYGYEHFCNFKWTPEGFTKVAEFAKGKIEGNIYIFSNYLAVQTNNAIRFVKALIF